METNSRSNSKIHLGALSALGFWLQNMICHEFEPHTFFQQEKQWYGQALGCPSPTKPHHRDAEHRG